MGPGQEPSALPRRGTDYTTTRPGSPPASPFRSRGEADAEVPQSPSHSPLKAWGRNSLEIQLGRMPVARVDSLPAGENTPLLRKLGELAAVFFALPVRVLDPVPL